MSRKTRRLGDCLCNGGSGGSVAGVAVEGRLQEVATLGGDADGEGVGTVGSGGGGADGGPLIGGVLAEEDDLFVGDGGAASSESAGDSERLSDRWVGV